MGFLKSKMPMLFASPYHKLCKEDRWKSLLGFRDLHVKRIWKVLKSKSANTAAITWGRGRAPSSLQLSCAELGNVRWGLGHFLGLSRYCQLLWWRSVLWGSHLCTGENKIGFIFKTLLSVFFKCQRKKTSIIQGNELEVSRRPCYLQQRSLFFSFQQSNYCPSLRVRCSCHIWHSS